MSKVQSWLTGLLVIQAVIVAIMFLGEQQQDSGDAKSPLAEFDPAAVNRVVVSDGDSSATLQKKDGQWVLPGLSDLPANKTQLTAMLDKVNGLSAGWPVATSESSHQRFEVAENKFQRRLQFYQGDDVVAELFLGTSPGFRQVHIRPAASEAVFSAELSTYEMPVETSDWLDKTLLSVNNIDRIKGPDYTLKKDNEQWAFADNENDNGDSKLQLNTEKARQLSSALTGLRIQNLSTEKMGDSVMTLQVSGADGKWDYQFSKVNEHYLVNRSDRKQVFGISQYDYERIVQIGLPQLAVESAKPGDKDVPEAAASSS